MTADIYDNPGKQVLSPARLAHVVLRTNAFETMKEFWKTFLGGHATHENEMLSFITYDEEHHRVALAAVPGTRPKDRSTAGLGKLALFHLPICGVL